ncbi:MAG: hypothetical protein ACXIUP_05845 [Microcella sp.]
MTIDDRMLARRARVAASSIVALVAVVAAAAAHAAAGGGIASAPTLALALLIGVPLGMLVVGRRVTLARASAGVVIDQAIFHGFFTFFGPAGGADAVAGHAHHGVALSALDAGPAAAALGFTPMLASHAGAAAIALLALIVGRDAIARALDSLTRTVLRAFETPVAVPAPSPAAPAVAVEHRPCTLAQRAVRAHPHRGPPVPLVSVAPSA